MKIQRAIVSVTAAGLMFFAAAASTPAQEPGQQPQQPQQPSQSSQQMTVQGELVQVDTETRMIVVRTEDNTPMSFRYNEKTEVSGTQESIAGLATTRGSRLTVEYTEEAGIRTATKIEVHAEEQGQQPQNPQQPRQ